MGRGGGSLISLSCWLTSICSCSDCKYSSATIKVENWDSHSMNLVFLPEPQTLLSLYPIYPAEATGLIVFIVLIIECHCTKFRCLFSVCPSPIYSINTIGPTDWLRQKLWRVSMKTDPDHLSEGWDCRTIGLLVAFRLPPRPGGIKICFCSIQGKCTCRMIFVPEYVVQGVLLEWMMIVASTARKNQAILNWLNNREDVIQTTSSMSLSTCDWHCRL